jgi:hypothetical protein
MNAHEALLACYLSGQIPEPEFEEILCQDDVFRKWFIAEMKKQGLNKC